jgi:hypothetical protein
MSYTIDRKFREDGFGDNVERDSPVCGRLRHLGTECRIGHLQYA